MARTFDLGDSASLTRTLTPQDIQLFAVMSGDVTPAHVDAESRMRLRSIDVQMLRILEEMAAGRQDTTSDLRTDIAALTRAVRLLARDGTPAGVRRG